jgi:hypothetical protein
MRNLAGHEVSLEGPPAADEFGGTAAANRESERGGVMGHLGGWKMLPTKPGVCPECAMAHETTQPHNAESMTYQYSFYDKHGRWPTWADALAHCSPEVQAF